MKVIGQNPDRKLFNFGAKKKLLEPAFLLIDWNNVINITYLLIVGVEEATAGIESLPDLKESLTRRFVATVNVKILHSIISYHWNFGSRDINVRYASKATNQRQRPGSFTINQKSPASGTGGARQISSSFELGCAWSNLGLHRTITCTPYVAV